MTTEAKPRVCDTYSMIEAATRRVDTRIVAEATPDGLYLAVNDCRTPADEDEDLVSLELSDEAAAGLLRACWRFFELSGRDPIAALNDAPRWRMPVNSQHVPAKVEIVPSA